MTIEEKMNKNEIIKIFEECGAILKGHFKLSSGMHSDTYLQCAKLLMHPQKADILCAQLAKNIRKKITPHTFPLPGKETNDPSPLSGGKSFNSSPLSGGIEGGGIDLVVAPAMGGVVVGYEVARQLGVPGIFCERVDGKFEFRRGFEVPQGANVLIVEDVVTTAKSSFETIECIERAGGKVVGEACLVDRSAGKHNLPFPLASLIELDVPTYDPANLPEHLKGTEAVKPGSRFLKSG